MLFCKYTRLKSKKTLEEGKMIRTSRTAMLLHALFTTKYSMVLIYEDSLVNKLIWFLVIF